MKNLISLVLLLNIGCATVKPRSMQEFMINDNVTIRMVDNCMNKDGCNYNHQAKACYFPNQRIIYIPYSDIKDKNGKYLPNLESLGHEIWHLQELGGDWHKPNENPYHKPKIKFPDEKFN